MKKLLLIRHGESEANRNRILASRLPYPLTDAGRNDARLIAEELKSRTTPDRIISSPLVRALETAKEFAAVFNLPVSEDERIAEQDLGIYSGMNYDEVKREEHYEPDPLKRWDWVPAGGGESYSMIADRLLSFFRELEGDEKDETLLIVTHAVAFRIIRAILKNTLPLYEAPFPNNGEIWRVDFKRIGDCHNIDSIFLGDSRSFVHNP
ncbi:histidine phosphatase family protein [Spirochaeta isovalerica]|uniref:phosphoglycerate mutase (2,3-diphosphoglycerate-dependent) n=1 Tax=Spirochaeta isovalerica TaxID=150 RepID=A0A841RF48_9SPIO|nr:histidine phosphatase family protein [Spirochaeta isovalerica]MBB6480982.1 broad specificity phosphatase PhoE [Spirochaeta isovalerica]